MGTKAAIAEKGRELFNARGTGAVSPRDIAEALGIAYGNLTYHFPRKGDLVRDLYLAMVAEHAAVAARLPPGPGLLRHMLLAPDAAFDISLKYLFLFRDYAEVLRAFPEVAKLHRESIPPRKAAFKGAFALLRKQKLLREDMDDGDVDFLMDASGAVRTFFFMDLGEAETHPAGLRKAYVRHMNRLFRPYLTKKGLAVYARAMKEAGL